MFHHADHAAHAALTTPRQVPQWQRPAPTRQRKPGIVARIIRTLKGTK